MLLAATRGPRQVAEVLVLASRRDHGTRIRVASMARRGNQMQSNAVELLPRIEALGVVPVIEIHVSGLAPALAETLISSGLPLLEVTLRTDEAIDAIRAISGMPDVVVGAGTVINADQVDRAADAGARYIVSPGLSAEVVERSAEHGLLCLPGVATPSEIMRALALGLDLVKMFPAETLGGVSALKAFAGPFPQVRFVPTGGITASSAPDYLALPAVLAVGGSWMVPRQSLADRDWATIGRLAKEAVVIGARRAG